MKTAHPYRFVGLSFLLLEAVSFFLFYCSAILFPEVGALAYLDRFFDLFASGLFPIGIAAVLLSALPKDGAAALLNLLPAVLTKALRTLPYYYLVFLSDVYDSVESLLLGLLVSAIEWIAVLLAALLLCLLMKVVRQKPEEPLKPSPFDLSDRGTLAVFSASAVLFVYRLVREVISLVSYLVDYAGDYEIYEIVYIAICFLFDLLCLLSWQACAVYLGTRFEAKRKELSEK